MSASFALACGWLILANVIAMFPSKKKHWPAAYVLMTLGAPLLVFVVWENGPWVGALMLLGAMSILRWPVKFAYQRVKGAFGRSVVDG